MGTATLRGKTSCLICDANNAAEAVLCASCAAPMALVHDALAQERDPRMVSIIGESNVGKTVFLGFLLDMLSQRAGDFEAVPKGAYSVDLSQTVISHMEARQFPPKTPMEANEWKWAYYQVRRRREEHNWVDLVMPDMAGEALAAEVAAPETFHVIRNLLAKSEGVLLLVDAALAANGSSRPDFFALKMMSYLDNMFGTKKRAKINTPIAIVLCKADYCPDCRDNPDEFVQANFNRLWNICETRYANVQFFTCSVVGSLAYAVPEGGEYVIPVPLHTALQGVLEPFEWILDRL